jgi:filamentous hemagglutinin
LSNPVLSTATKVVNNALNFTKTDNARVKAMAAGSVAWNLKETVSGVQDIINPPVDADGNPVKTNVKDVNLSIVFGTSKSKSEVHSQGSDASESVVMAGGQVDISATGGGKDSNILVVGSDIFGREGVSLTAENDITLASAQSWREDQYKNSSSGWNLGINAGTSGVGVTVGGSISRGRGDGASVSERNSFVGSEGLITIESGGDTTIKGARVEGNRVEVDATNLHIESVQDRGNYQGNQAGGSLQLTIGISSPSGISGGFDYSKIKAEHESINSQSGIITGDGGYRVNVKENTNLIGGIITSTQAAEDAGRNSVTTGTLTSQDLENKSVYDGVAISVGGGLSWSSQESYNSESGDIEKTTAFGASHSMGWGLVDEGQQSVTKSGINTDNITITDRVGQAATGKTVEEILEEVKTSTTTATVDQDSGALKNTFDRNKVQAELDVQVQVTKDFNEAVAGMTGQIAELKEKAKAEGRLEDAENWETADKLLKTISGGLSGSNANGAIGTIANMAAPHIAQEIGQFFKQPENQNNEAGHILAHSVLGAALAAATGNNVLMGALAAGSAEAIAPILSNYLYGETDPSKLTTDQKQTISALSSLTGATVGALLGDSSLDSVSGSYIAQNSVDNNDLSSRQRKQAILEEQAQETTLGKLLNALKWQGISMYQGTQETAGVVVGAVGFVPILTVQALPQIPDMAKGIGLLFQGEVTI